MGAGSDTRRGWRWIQALVLCGALLAPAFHATTAEAALTLTVTTTADTVDAAPGNGTCADGGGNCSLRAAVMEANAHAGADTIIVPPGVYTLTIPGRDENASATGDLDITDPVTITGAGGNRDGNPAATIIQAGTAKDTGIDKVLSINPNFDKAFATTIEALTIRYGYNTSNRSGDGYGGGLDWEASGTGTLTIYNCHIADNTAASGDGGGLMVSNGPNTATALVTITKSQFYGNVTSNGIGGGMFVGFATPFIISDSVFAFNSAYSGSSSTGAGGGLFSFGPATGAPANVISGSLFTDNVGNGSGSDGGGIYSTAPLVISNTTIANNVVGRNGGGLYMSLAAGSAPSLTNVTISGNRAGGAGGGYAQDGVTNGAAVPATVRNVTVTGNRAATGAGIWRDASIVTMTMHNSIVGGNFQGASSTPDDVSGVLEAASSHNLIGPGGAGGLTNGSNGNQVGVTNLGLAPLANNGGLTPTHALLHGSPALDAGSNALAPATDQRGGPRIADSADADATATVDIGAFEAHPTLDDIGNQTTPAGTPVSVTFHVGDNSLGISGITATSANTVLLPPGSLTVGAGPSPTTRTLTITPAAGQSGTATVTVTATAGVGSMSDTFELTVTAPPPPVEFVTIDPPPAETRDASIVVTGDANPGYTVQVNGAPAVADGAGNWSLTVPLAEGPNTITAVNGPASASVSVVRDSTPPILTLIPSETRTEAGTVTLTATSEPGVTILIEGQATNPLTVPLVLGNNTFTATATDRLGNQATASVTVERVAPPPVPFVTINPPAAETRDASIAVTGTANPGFTVQVNGAPAVADAAGNWSLTVPLVEGANTITAVNAPASASVTVVRDSTPPVLTLTASETRTEAASVTLTASSEPGAVVRIEGQATNPLTVPLVFGLNTFVATATDHLGNQATASVTVERVVPAPPPEPVRYVTIDLPVAETREASILVTGRANPFYTIQVNGAPVQASAAGVWSLSVALAEGPNTITAVNGAAIAAAAVLRDSTPPVLTLTAAETRTEAQSVTLTATSEPGASIQIEGQATATLTVPLVLGNNTFSATATDRLGNQAAASVTVERVAPPPPPEPVPTLSALPAEVEAPDLTMTGTAMAGTTITLLVNGEPQGTVAVDAAGAFTADVTLAEGSNRLVARSASGLTSGEAVVVYRRPIHFTDVAGHWAEAAIYRMARRGVVQGFPDETFRPEDQVTRLEYAVMLSRLLGLTPSDGALPFSDADQVPEWARPALAAAVAAGIVEGHADGRFAPDDLVTRAEAAVMLVRAFRYASGVSATGHVTFTDQDEIPAWAAEAVSAAAANHLVIGYADGSFRPAGPATRAEAVTMLDRLLELLAR